MNMLRISSFVAAAALVGLTMAPAQADGLQQVATFKSGTSQLILDTYTEGATVVGLIGIKTAKTESYSFGKSEFVTLLALWTKAQSLSGAAYTAAGSVAETSTKALDVLLLAGGPTMRFSIADPIRGVQLFDLAPADYAAFDAAFHKMGDVLTD
jgi:hypothetical protein